MSLLFYELQALKSINPASIQLIHPANLELLNPQPDASLPTPPTLKRQDSKASQSDSICQLIMTAQIKPPSEKKLMLQNSDLQLRYLPPIELRITISQNYPEHEAPFILELKCDWLFEIQKNHIIKHLNEIWIETQGEEEIPELPLLIKRLSSENGSKIQSKTDQKQVKNGNLQLSVNAQPFTPSSIKLHQQQQSKKPTAKQQNILLKQSLAQMLRQYNYKCYKEQFDWRGKIICQICCAEKQSSSDFIILKSCLHHFCTTCTQAMFQQLINQRQFDKLHCPYCPSLPLPENQLRDQILPHKIFQRYQKLSIQLALSQTDLKDTFTWCSMTDCKGMAEIIQQQYLAECQQCSFKACIICRQEWHPGRRCPSTYITRPKNNSNSSSFLSYHKKVEELNSLYLQSCTKKCPQCKVHVHKFGGCNKVACACCHKYFCWLCMAKDIEYSHFNGQGTMCEGRLFDTSMDHLQMLIEGDKFIEDTKAFKEKEETNLRSIRCGYCRKILVKPDELNRIDCKSCNMSTCFQCGVVLEDVKQDRHFSIYPCKSKQTIDDLIKDAITLAAKDQANGVH